MMVPRRRRADARNRLLLLRFVLAIAVAGFFSAGAVAQSWQDLSPRQRYDAMQNYRSYERQPEEKRRKVEEGYERWQRMPPQERDRVRRNYERYQQLPPSDQQRLEKKYERWKRRGGAER